MDHDDVVTRVATALAVIIHSKATNDATLSQLLLVSKRREADNDDDDEAEGYTPNRHDDSVLSAATSASGSEGKGSGKKNRTNQLAFLRLKELVQQAYHEQLYETILTLEQENEKLLKEQQQAARESNVQAHTANDAASPNRGLIHDLERTIERQRRVLEDDRAVLVSLHDRWNAAQASDAQSIRELRDKCRDLETRLDFALAEKSTADAHVSRWRAQCASDEDKQAQLSRQLGDQRVRMESYDAALRLRDDEVAEQKRRAAALAAEVDRLQKLQEQPSPNKQETSQEVAALRAKLSAAQCDATRHRDAAIALKRDKEHLQKQIADQLTKQRQLQQLLDSAQSRASVTDRRLSKLQSTSEREQTQNKTEQHKKESEAKSLQRQLTQYQSLLSQLATEYDSLFQREMHARVAADEYAHRFCLFQLWSDKLLHLRQDFSTGVVALTKHEAACRRLLLESTVRSLMRNVEERNEAMSDLLSYFSPESSSSLPLAITNGVAASSSSSSRRQQRGLHTQATPSTIGRSNAGNTADRDSASNSTQLVSEGDVNLLFS